MAFTIPNAASAAYPAQAEIFQTDLDILVASLSNIYVVSGCAVTAQGSPDMTVAVAAGAVVVDSVYIPVVAGNVTITTAHATLPRIDLITVDTSGVKAALAGTAATNPLPAAHPSSKVVISQVYVPALATTIPSNNIYDRRAINGNGPGLELDSAEVDSSPSNITTTLADVTGLSITFNAPSRPFIVEIHIPVCTLSAIATTPAFVQFSLCDSSDTVLSNGFGTVGVSGHSIGPVIMKTRLPRTGTGAYSITPGTSYTFKVRAYVTSGTGTIVVSSGSNRPYIRAETC